MLSISSKIAKVVYVVTHSPIRLAADISGYMLIQRVNKTGPWTNETWGPINDDGKKHSCLSSVNTYHEK